MDKVASNHSIFDKTFRDKDGNLAIAQIPNIPVVTWLVASLLAKLIAHGKAHNLFRDITFGALVTWALMEIFTGSSYFRRLLGLVVLMSMVYGKLK